MWPQHHGYFAPVTLPYAAGDGGRAQRPSQSVLCNRQTGVSECNRKLAAPVTSLLPCTTPLCHRLPKRNTAAVLRGLSSFSYYLRVNFWALVNGAGFQRKSTQHLSLHPWWICSISTAAQDENVGTVWRVHHAAQDRGVAWLLFNIVAQHFCLLNIYQQNHRRIKKIAIYFQVIYMTEKIHK